MGKLQTAVTLPKRILLQGWAGDQSNNDINGEYTFYYESYLENGAVIPLQNIYLNLNKIASDGVPDSENILRPAIGFYINSWFHESEDDGWSNPSTNPNVLPLNGWIENNAQGPAGTITILENISGKNNKISIKKQNTGSGKINAYKTNDYIFSYNSAIDFSTSCEDDGDYYATQADPYQISFNVNLPKKPKQVQVKLKGIGGDNIRYMGIVITNPQNKPCFINQYNFYSDYHKDRRLTQIPHINALVTDDAQDGLFQTGIGGLLSNDITGRPYTITGSSASSCRADFFFTGYIRVDSNCQSQMGFFASPCGSPPNIVSGFLPSVDGLAGAGSSSKNYYTKLNKLIDNNYNGTWKISSWNHWASDPSDVQNYINNGIDLIFKF